jgi:4-amino-4-deoxy-L-arabinose transferase-like glycosyltransferase
LQVARNWVESGHYGRLIAGEPTSSRLAASFYAIAPIALSFEFFGVGIWQGRLPALLLTFAALALIIFLASRLYHRKIVAGTLFVLMLMPTTNELHSLYLGRQVISEMPALFYLLAGYFVLVFILAPICLVDNFGSYIPGYSIQDKSSDAPLYFSFTFVSYVYCFAEALVAASCDARFSSDWVVGNL